NPERARTYSLRRLAMTSTSRGAALRPGVAGRTRRRWPPLAGALAAGVGRAGAEPPPEPAAASAALRGAVRSSAHDSRWFAPGRCTSQQVSEQKASAVRARLQVETLQTQ